MSITKKEFIEFIYPEYYKHQAMVEAADKMYELFKDEITTKNTDPIAKDCLKVVDNTISVTADGYIKVGRFLIMLVNWSGATPLGASYKRNGNWYYDYEAANSIQFPDKFRLPSVCEWKEICGLLNNSSIGIQDVLYLSLNGFYNGISTECDNIGYYWSSSLCDSNNAFNLRIYDSFVNPRNNMTVYWGCSVRGIKLINE